jgi:transposase
LKKVAQMMHRHLKNVSMYFDHRITNAISKELNSKIQMIKKECDVFPGLASYNDTRDRTVRTG